MGGGNTHLGYGRSPEELEREIQQLKGESIRQGDIINNLLEALGIQIENLTVNEGDRYDRFDGDVNSIWNISSILQNAITNTIQNNTFDIGGDSFSLTEELLQEITQSVINNLNQLSPRPNVWEAYTGS